MCSVVTVTTLNHCTVPLFQVPIEKFKGKLNLRVMIPEHCCSAVIGPKGANVKHIKEVLYIFISPQTASH